MEVNKTRSWLMIAHWIISLMHGHFPGIGILLVVAAVPGAAIDCDRQNMMPCIQSVDYRLPGMGRTMLRYLEVCTPVLGFPCFALHCQLYQQSLHHLSDFAIPGIGKLQEMEAFGPSCLTHVLTLTCLSEALLEAFSHFINPAGISRWPELEQLGVWPWPFSALSPAAVSALRSPVMSMTGCSPNLRHSNIY